MQAALRLLPLVTFLVLLAATTFAASEITGRVVKVSDGDTITALASGNRQAKIRLYGIDCPERKQAFGNRARQFTARMIAGQTVRVEVMDTDRYGRLVGIVYMENGLDLNSELLEAGLAWVYPQYCKAAFCDEWRKLETRARRAAVGLWIDKNPVPPWQWRKERKK